MYDVREGWAPLCRFLGLPVPEEPYPKINDSDTIEFVVKTGYYFLVFGVPVVVAVALYACWAKLKFGRSAVLRILVPVLYVLNSKCLRRAKDNLRSSSAGSASDPVANVVYKRL